MQSNIMSIDDMFFVTLKCNTKKDNDVDRLQHPSLLSIVDLLSRESSEYIAPMEYEMVGKLWGCFGKPLYTKCFT